MKKVTLHIDSRPNYIGQVLEVTDESGDTIPYTIEYADADDMGKFATASKLFFHTGSEHKAREKTVRYFSAMLGSAARIDVYGERIRRRFPSTCVYSFCGLSSPVCGADPPFNFEYGVAKMVTPVTIEGDKDNLPEAMSLVNADAFGAHAHGFPGISNRASLIELFKKLACPEIEEDVLSVPWYAEYRDQWCPTLRDDGHIGLFEAVTQPKQTYLVVESALPYFVCDQLICGVRANVDSWTWSEWAESDEVVTARQLAVETVNAVAARALLTLSGSKTKVSEVANRVTAEKFVTVSNVLRKKEADEWVTFDAEIAQRSDWHRGRTLLVSLVRREGGEKAYAIVRNMNCGTQVVDVTLPTTFVVERFEDAEEAILLHFGDLRGIFEVRVLVRI